MILLKGRQKYEQGDSGVSHCLKMNREGVRCEDQDQSLQDQNLGPNIGIKKITKTCMGEYQGKKTMQQKQKQKTETKSIKCRTKPGNKRYGLRRKHTQGTYTL